MGAGFVAYAEELPGAITEGDTLSRLARIYVTLLRNCSRPIANLAGNLLQGKKLAEEANCIASLKIRFAVYSFALIPVSDLMKKIL